MAQILNLSVLNLLPNSSRTCSQSLCSIRSSEFRCTPPVTDWSSLQQRFRFNGRVSCLFSNNRGQEQAKKALEIALGGKKSEFEKWNKEIEKREEAGGGNAGGGGWFGWGGRFGWNNNGDNFWQESQQAILAILGILAMYFLIAKGEVLLAVVLNPMLYALRWTRRGLTLISSQISRSISPNAGRTKYDDAPHMKEMHIRVSAKEEVLRKWGTN